MTLEGIVLYVFFVITVLATSIVVHELTHALLYWRITGHKPTIKITLNSIRLISPYNFEDTNDSQFKFILWGGIIMGGTIIMLFINWLDPISITALICLYLIGCKGDFQRIKALSKTKQGTET